MAEKNVNIPVSQTKPNYLYSIVSVAMVLLLLGMFGLILIHAQILVRYFKEKINVLVELEDGRTEDDTKRLEKALVQSQYVKDGTVEYISKADAAEMMRKEFGDDFLKLDLPNPLYDVLSFNVKSEYMRPDSLDRIRRGLLRQSYVTDVFYQETLVDQIGKNIQRLGYVALLIGIFFIFVAITLIHNTIRLALYSNRFIIKNMELVGASWNFISRPYLMRSVKHGLFSGLIAIVLLYLIVYWSRLEIPQLKLLPTTTFIIILFVFLVLIGILINSLSTFYVVKKYLKMRVDDLY